MRRSGWTAIASVAVLALLTVPGFSSGTAPASAGVVQYASPMMTVSPVLPSALSAPWSDRVGYIPGIRSDPGSTSPATGPVLVDVTLWPRDLAMFAPRLPGAAPLTESEFIQRYSPTVAEYQSVIGYFTSQGLVVVHTWPDRLSVTFEGPAGRVAAAFGTTLLRGTVGGAPMMYPATVPQLPPFLSAEISAVSGLSQGFSRFTLPLAPVDPAIRSSSRLGAAIGSTTSEVTPSGAHGAYGMDALYNLSGSFHAATNQHIVLLLWGDGYAPADITTFFSSYYPSEYPVAPTWQPHPIDGAPAPSANAVNDPSGGPQELTLDLEWSGSMAPGAHLDAVYAPDGPPPSYSPNDTPMEDALSTAVNSISGVTVISMSFGLAESQDASFQAAYSTLFGEAQTRGITVLGASGDDGGSVLSRGACTPSPEVEFPASSPEVMAVGGTQPTLNVSLSGQITGIATEPAWNRSGGGLSQDYAAPSWQLVGSAGAAIGSGGRGVPDVSGPAADNMLYYNGQVGQLAGTSFATPMWAGLVAELDAVWGTPLGFVTPRLYALASQEERPGSAHAFSDITAGANCLNPARSGWDDVTGWGTPHTLLLYAALTRTIVSLAVTPAPSSIFPGGSTTVTVVVKNGTTGLPISGVTVNLTFGASDGYTGPCGGSFGTSGIVTDANGSGQARFSAPLCYFGSQATVSALLLSGGYFGQAFASVAVSLLSGSGFVSLISTFPYNAIFFTFIVVIALIVGVVLSRRGRRRRRLRTASFPPSGAAGSTGPIARWTPPPSYAPPPPGPAAPERPATGPETSWSAPASPDPGGMWSPVDTRPLGTVEARPMPEAVRCPSCGASIPEFSLSCPRCGLARP